MEISRAKNFVVTPDVKVEKPVLKKEQPAESKKTLDTGVWHVVDTFEHVKTESEHTTAAYTSAKSAEPEKKADQATGDLLMKQMTQARLAESGRKQATKESEHSGRSDLTSKEQEAAAAKQPKIPESGGRKTGGSDDQREAKDLQDYAEKHGRGAGGSGAGTSSSTTAGRGVGTAASGEYGKKVKDAMGEMQGSSGSGNARDRLSEKMAAQKGYGNTADDARKALHDQLRDAVTSNGGAAAGRGYSKNMISEESHWMNHGGPLDYQTTWHDKETGEDVTETRQTKFNKDSVETILVVDRAKDGERTSRDIYKLEEKKNADGSTSVTTSELKKDKDGKAVWVPITGGSSEEGGTTGQAPTGKETSQDEYAKQQSEKVHNVMKKLGSRFGIDPYALPKSNHSPGHNSGNVDGKEGVDKGGLETNVFFQAGGVNGMVGQSHGSDSDRGSFHAPQTGTADGTGYSGETRKEDEADVDTTVGDDTLKDTASRSNTSEKEEEKKRSYTRPRKS